jgi:hypothetical protein
VRQPAGADLATVLAWPRRQAEQALSVLSQWLENAKHTVSSAIDDYGHLAAAPAINLTEKKVDTVPKKKAVRPSWVKDAESGSSGSSLVVVNRTDGSVAGFRLSKVALVSAAEREGEAVPTGR